MSEQQNQFERVQALINDINVDRYGRPLMAALHLCLELANELFTEKENHADTLSGAVALKQQLEEQFNTVYQAEKKLSQLEGQIAKLEKRMTELE